jgi:putative tryptophan/tyrosine transport system substrate-binding protein
MLRGLIAFCLLRRALVLKRLDLAIEYYGRSSPPDHRHAHATNGAIAFYAIALANLRAIRHLEARGRVLRDAIDALAVGTGQFGAIQSVAPSFGVELTPVGVRDAEEIERGITAFAQGANGGLIMTGSTGALFHRGLIVGLAARHRLPAVYFGRYFVTGGGLISYGPDFIDLFRRPASYVDRILKGEKPSELPVQNPTKYELVINLKTAKALGIEVPATVLARADEVIE